MRGKWLLISGTAVLAAVALGVLRHRDSSGPAPSAAAPEVLAPPASEVSLPGRIRAREVVPVGAPIDGIFDELLVDEGEYVYEGQLLGRIRNTGLESERQAAISDAERARERVNRLESDLVALRLEASRTRADATRAQMELDRIERAHSREQMLYREGATPRLAFEKSAIDFQEARVERDTRHELARVAEDRLSAFNRSLDAARVALEETTRELEAATEHAAAAEIHAPVDGLVIALTRHLGEEVTPEVEDLIHIAVNLGALEAVVEPEPPILERIRPGLEALILIAELPYPIPGAVERVDGNQVIVEFTSPDPAIAPGQTAQVRINLE